MADAPPVPTSDGDRPFQSLYRRYRPQRFDDVRGQGHVTRALRNAVRDDRVAHAYLFSGPRGTGKTSTARILAMALNCAHPVEGEPDGVCPSCVDIRRGSSLDVQELDAASNRKIDEMRDLLSRVALGTSGRWKVYIVDEVHQLTSDAASALLKTLEEPPSHVVFVLATTDAQKVLPTIRSRTQHFEFRLLAPDVLTGLLRDVNDRAGLGLAPGAIDLVVRRGHGSARDALSVLDQVAAAGEVEDQSDHTSAIIDAVATRDAGLVLTAVAEAVSAGRDPRRLATDLLDQLRNGFLATEARGLVRLPDDAVAEVEEQARRLGLAGVVRAMDIVGQASVDMRDSADPRITLEVALVRLATPRADESAGAMLRRLEWLEAQVAALTGAGAPAAAAAPAAPSPAVRVPLPPAAAPPASPGGVPASPAAAPAGAPTSPAASPPAGAPAPPAASPPAAPPAGAPASPASPGGVPASPAGAPAAPPGLRRQAPPGVTSAHSRVGAPPPQPGRSRPQPPAKAHQSEPARPPTPKAALGAHRRVVPPAAAVSGAGGPALPSRDELTKAWGDDVLPTLRPAVKAYISAGRFVAVDGSAAVYAVPDQGLLDRAQPFQAELEAALTSHFGRPVPIRLVLDRGFVPTGLSPAVIEVPDAAEEDDPSSYNLDELPDAGPALVSPEQRLLEAFPGAEEVTP